MQRRAATVYGAFFLVLALGSYGMIAAASAPTISVQDPDFRGTNDSQFTVGGVAHHVTVNNQTPSATIRWTDPAADYVETWEDGQEVTFQGTAYRVAIPNESDPTTLQLTEVRTLPEDVQTTTVNGTEYVVVERDAGTRELVTTEEYLDDTQGPAETRELVEGRTYDNAGNRTTLETVTNSSATLTWTAPRAHSEQVSEGETVELSGETFVAHFPTPDRLVLDRDVEAYEAQLAVIDTYHERINGLWGVSILSGLTVVTLFGLSYLPSRY